MDRTPSKFRLRQPAGYDTIEGWLVEHDNQPRCIPRWPQSKRMCLVACTVENFAEPTEKPAEAYVLVKESQANNLVNFCGPGAAYAVLFFRVLRMTVLQDDVRPAGLTAESWEQSV